jgi:hypothetical protein
MRKIFYIVVTLFLLTNFAGYSQKNCEPITTFPWTEGFENNGTEIPQCWEHTSNFPFEWHWTVVPDSVGIPSTSHDGSSKARIFKNHTILPVYTAKLFTPIFDLSVLDIPVFNFWYTQMQPSTNLPNLSIYYKNSSSGEWILLKSFSDNNIDWQKESLLLPNKSDHYQIAFQGTFRGGHYDIQLDDVSIFDANIQTFSYQVNISTNSGISSNGAIVTLSNQDENHHHVYTEVSDNTGVTFHAIISGIYNLTIELDGYDDYIVTDLVINESGLEHTALLIETLVAPIDLSIEINHENRSASFRWKHGNFPKSFKGFTILLDNEDIATVVQNNEYLFTNLEDGNHTAGVKAEYSSGFSEIATIPFHVLRIKENSLMQLMLSPNPVLDFLKVKYSNTTTTAVAIYNSIGMLVHFFETAETEFVINVSNYYSGVYFIRLLNSNASAIKSFVKQ